MKIIINDRRKIFVVQKEFSELFPYLKIEFYAKAVKSGESSSNKLVKHAAKTLGECRTTHKSGTITITPKMTVAGLEDGFSSVYGLNAIIFRKSGKLWLETTVTDQWTLEEQNKQGELLSKLHNVAV
jgi:hypothetical protein